MVTLSCPPLRESHGPGGLVPVLRWCCLFLLTALLTCPGSFAAEPTELKELAERYVEAFSQKSQQESRQNQPKAVGRDFTVDFPNARNLTPEENGKLKGFVDGQLENLTAEIRDRHTELKHDLETLKNNWILERTDLYDKQIEISNTGAGTSFAGTVKVIVGSKNRFFYLFSLVAMAILMAIHWHSRRHEYRRMLMGSRARSMGLARVLRYLFLTFLVLFLVVFIFGDAIERLLGNIDNPGAITFSTFLEEVQDLEKEVASGKAGQANAEVASPYADAQENRAMADVLSKVSIAYNLDNEKLVVTHDKFKAKIEDINGQRNRSFFIRIGIALLLSLFLFGFSFILFRNLKQYRQDIADTCPQCLGVGSFEQVQSEFEFSNLDILRCTTMDQENNVDCGFELHGIHREKTKLSFPTLGVPQAGKTHWLCMVYRELIRGAFDDIVNFERVRGESSDEMDRRVEEIIDDRLDPEGTRTDALPKPLIFDFTDNDFWGKSNVLVNIFDYAGEITQNRPLDDPQRQRALNADGYLFFIDPTDGASADEQAKALVDFQEDLRVIKKTSTGKSIRTPVAICVPKLDLMINQDYADSSGRGAVSRFYQELSAIEQNGSSISLENINKRSNLMMKFRDTVWPGWRIERQINDLFGGRFRFFPLTPVGMGDLGQTELRDRTIEPFAILEPLMWLLHMNGFKVLS